MAGPVPYYAEGSLSSTFYDVVTAADTTLAGDVEAYAAMAPAGGEVLELGAGSGRLSFALAALGLRVTGVEIAPAMLAQAKAALPAGLADRVALRLGDMRALDLDRTFDLVVAPFFTLAHVPVEPDWRLTFRTAARHLRPGGRAAFHLPLARMMALPGPADPERPVFDQPLPGGGRLQLHVRDRAFDAAAGRMDQLIEYVERNAAGEVARRATERQTYFIADPRPLAAEAGLDFDGKTLLGGVGEIWEFRRGAQL